MNDGAVKTVRCGVGHVSCLLDKCGREPEPIGERTSGRESAQITLRGRGRVSACHIVSWLQSSLVSISSSVRFCFVAASAEPTYTDDNYDDYYNDNDGVDVDRYDDGGGSVFDIDDDKWSRSYDDEWDRCYTPKRDDDNWLRVPKSGKTKGGKTKGGYYSSKGGKTKGSKYYGDYGW